MKRLVTSFAAMLLSGAASAYELTTAETLAQTHTSEQAHEIGLEFGVSHYHGPYDKEQPVLPCSITSHPDCINYAGYQLGSNIFERVSERSSQSVENYIYYHAYRNAMAGYYAAGGAGYYKEWVEGVGLNNLIGIEVFLIKSGQKGMTMFKNLNSHGFIVTAAEGAYQ